MHKTVKIAQSTKPRRLNKQQQNKTKNLLLILSSVLPLGTSDWKLRCLHSY